MLAIIVGATVLTGTFSALLLAMIGPYSWPVNAIGGLGFFVYVGALFMQAVRS